jgi:hypothetical protein
MTDQAFTVPAKHGHRGEGGGRPFVAIDLDTVERAASIGCPVDEIAALLGIGRSTLYDHLNADGKYYDPKVAEAIEKGRATGKSTIRRMQWEKANTGDTAMLIWLGKVVLQQRDTSVIAHTGPDGGPVQTVHQVSLTDPVEASKAYQKIMGGDN